jgi:hypothetical protein
VMPEQARFKYMKSQMQSGLILNPSVASSVQSYGIMI